jgi:poly-gamma-glutamate synthase PgsB/CapB
MQVFYLLLSLVIIAIVMAVMEFRNHQKRIYSIPIRIHVNGTRGKSSVTRLIGAALNEGGIKTITKVTGTYPRLILENGTETSIHRKAGANIIEQLAIVKFAAERKADALLIECMALEPQYQTITETKMIHATIGVVTNVRLDHVDVMGYTLPEIASVLGRTIPKNQNFFTAENQIPDIMKRLADEKKSVMHLSNPLSVTDDEMKRFSYIEHKENVALVLEVCSHLGISRETAFRGMYKAIPDEGALNRFSINMFEKKITFYNAFAANDPQSTLMIWEKLSDESCLEGNKIILLNTRQDRMDRAKQLAEMVGKEINSEADYLALIGQSTDVVENMAVGYGFEKSRIVNIGWTDPPEVFEKILSLTNKTSTVVSIGNIGGMGGKVVEYFENRSIGNG